MSTGDQATALRAQIFDKFALIINKADPRDSRFYSNKMGVQDRTSEGNRDAADDYQLSYIPVLNLGRLYASLDADGQRNLVTMAAHQMRRESPYCRWTPQIFLFLAKYVDFGKAFETVLEHLKLDEVGGHTLASVSAFIAHDHSLIADEMLESMSAKLKGKLNSLKNDTYEHWRMTPHDGGRGPGYIAYERARNMAHKVLARMVEVRHMRLENALAECPVLRKAVAHANFKTGDLELDELLQSAQRKFLSANPVMRKESIERLWDAWERLKTQEPGKDKKNSARALLDKVSTEPAFRKCLETELSTDIRNVPLLTTLEMSPFS